MSLHTIKNLMGKFSNQEINILYFPALSVLDSAILDIPVNYYGNTNIRHPNLTNISELTWANYDFIFTHSINETVINLSNTFHIPILYYISNKNKINKTYPKNIVYLYDTLSPIEMDNLICINLRVDLPVSNINTLNTKNCVFINYHFEKINETLKNDIQNKIPDATFIDHLPSLKDLSHIFAEHKVCVDFSSYGHYEAILAIKNLCSYLRFNDKNTDIENKYDNLSSIDHFNDETYQNLTEFYNINQFNNDIKLINSQTNKDAKKDLSSVYGFMKFRRYVI